MVTALKPENESTAAVAETVAPIAPVAEPVAAVAVATVPETPAELLKQWDASRKPLLHTVVAATLVRAWNLLAGPGMTERDRLNREIAQAKGHLNGIRKML